MLEIHSKKMIMNIEKKLKMSTYLLILVIVIISLLLEHTNIINISKDMKMLIGYILLIYIMLHYMMITTILICIDINDQRKIYRVLLFCGSIIILLVLILITFACLNTPPSIVEERRQFVEEMKNQTKYGNTIIRWFVIVFTVIFVFITNIIQKRGKERSDIRHKKIVKKVK